jgi:hypothetical protein
VSLSMEQRLLFLTLLDAGRDGEWSTGLGWPPLALRGWRCDQAMRGAISRQRLTSMLSPLYQANIT